jgi:hypothetical protein
MVDGVEGRYMEGQLRRLFSGGETILGHHPMREVDHVLQNRRSILAWL